MAAAETETAADEEAVRAMNELGGRSIDDLATDAEGEDGEEQEQETPPTQMSIPGYEQRVSLAVGGATPDESQVSIMSASRRVDGQFKKGEVVRLEIVGRVVDISFPDSTDAYGNVTSTKRRHKIRPITISISESAESES